MQMSKINIGIKKDYCDWLTRQMIANAKEYLDEPDRSAQIKLILANPPKWGVAPTMDVLQSFGTQSGVVLLMRLLLDLPPVQPAGQVHIPAMTDEQLYELLSEDGTELMAVFAKVRDEADPKAQRGLVGSNMSNENQQTA